ncbi:hypothetical protein V1477_010169 [Vespula maculifrons]|uniref:Uncharacterized protein n=1 Tax=Vespula maculifrons TaxID=7453 RepID=A0ABD2C9X4_VESMC
MNQRNAKDTKRCFNCEIKHHSGLMQLQTRSSRICIQYDTSLSRIGIERGERIIEDSKPIGFRKRIREKEKRNGRNPLKIVQWNITAEFMKKIGPSVWSEPEFKSGSFCFPDDCFGSLSYPQALSLTFS